MIKKIINHYNRILNRNFDKIRYFKESLNQILKECSKKDRTIWFIGSAHYDNIGDLAITSSTIKFLNTNFSDTFNIFEIRLCDYFKYEKAVLKKIKNDDIIVLQGGGNMGFNYFEAEFNRRRVIKKFKENKIIIFPSTIDYGNTKRERYELKQSIKIYNKHKKLTIIAREEKSYILLKKYYSKNSIILEPDIVLFNEKINSKHNKNNIGLCLRSDLESTKNDKININTLTQKYNVKITDNIASKKNIEIHERDYIIERKLDELSSFELVITDRLHVIIFCAITCTPCLFVNNSNCKNEGVYNLWLKKYNYIRKLDYNYNVIDQIENFINTKKEYNYQKCEFKKLENEFWQ